MDLTLRVVEIIMVISVDVRAGVGRLEVTSGLHG